MGKGISDNSMTESKTGRRKINGPNRILQQTKGRRAIRRSGTVGPVTNLNWTAADLKPLIPGTCATGGGAEGSEECDQSVGSCGGPGGWRVGGFTTAR